MMPLNICWCIDLATVNARQRAALDRRADILAALRLHPLGMTRRQLETLTGASEGGVHAAIVALTVECPNLGELDVPGERHPRILLWPNEDGYVTWRAGASFNDGDRWRKWALGTGDRDPEDCTMPHGRIAILPTKPHTQNVRWGRPWLAL